MYDSTFPAAFFATEFKKKNLQFSWYAWTTSDQTEMLDIYSLGTAECI